MSLKTSARYLARSLLRDNVFSRVRLQRLLDHEKWTPEALRLENDALLHRSLAAACRKLPFYRQFGSTLQEGDIQSVLRHAFPIVSKDDLLADRALFYPDSGRRRPWTIIGMTSGTTGTPLEVFRSADSVLWEQAFIGRHMTWSGFKIGMPRASLRGDLIVPLTQTSPPLWFHHARENQLFVSSRHLKDALVEHIIDKLQQFSPYLMEAYPSTAYDLASFLARRKRFLDIPFVFTGSEAMYDHQRELIQERFRTRVFDFYGMAERVAFASECEHGNLHVNTDYSFVEIVDDAGNPTDDDGFIVGTTYHNLTMPLVRYRLSDRTRWKAGTCPCGRPYPMIEPVTGKYEDRLYRGDGSPVSPSVVTFAFKGVEHIKYSQVAQVGEDRWEVRVVPHAEFASDDETLLIGNLRKHVDPNLNVKLVRVKEIPRTKSGKYRWIVNEHRRGSS